MNAEASVPSTIKADLLEAGSGPTVMLVHSSVPRLTCSIDVKGALNSHQGGSLFQRGLGASERNRDPKCVVT